MTLRARLRRAVLVLAVMAAPLAATADDSAALRTYLDGLKSLQANFAQQRFDETGELLETARGDCKLQRPGRFRWEYAEPYRQTIVSNGRKLWIHDADLAQVTVNDVTPDAPGTPAELLSAEFDIDTRYTIEHLGLRDGVDWYALKPRDPASQFSSVELGLANGEIAAMKLADNLGQTTALSFSAVQRNVALPADIFEFTPPPGADVVEGGTP